MGGRGSGGPRVGSGRKSKSARILNLHGGRDRKKATTPATETPAAPVEMPGDLPAEQRAVWCDLAPHAQTQRTLIAATVAAFRDLCEAVVLKRALLEQIQKDGLTYLKHTVDGAGNEHEELKAHPLLAQHRGMMQRVEAGFAKFRLAPIGKEMGSPVEVKDPFEEFDASQAQ